MTKIKISLFSIEDIFFPIDKFLKFEVMEYPIHCVLNRSSLILCKLLALYSTLKLELGSKFSQFIHRFEIGIFECYSKAVLPSFSQFTEILEFFNVALAGLLSFYQFRK